MNRKFMVHWMGNIRNGDFMMRKKKVPLRLWFPVSSANLLLSGCRTADEPATKSGFYFNTVISVSIYEKGARNCFDDCFALCAKVRGIFFQYDSETAIFPKSTMRAALP